MEILQFLIYFLLDEYGGEKLAPLTECMKENDYDLSKTLKNISPEKLAPIVKLFMEKTKKRSEKPERQFLTPIKNIASSEIFECIEKYFVSLT